MNIIKNSLIDICIDEYYHKIISKIEKNNLYDPFMFSECLRIVKLIIFQIIPFSLLNGNCKSLSSEGLKHVLFANLLHSFAESVIE
ncbi:hypothetical protein BpHYR1_000421 [Brachionus plicatilis]|uniref:Uncharacterized protein n=1 Tax=Brachionus plicatilis TaxID=10195 RepID=A0A3M7RU63_BRAPC|nr:hypothetical protein BpHYR1_000421 [Brachionus plicatilis]